MSRSSLHHLALLSSALLLLVTSVDVDAQLKPLNTVGFAATGFTAGLALTAGAECTDGGFVCIPSEMVAASLFGALTGAIIGHAVADGVEKEVEAGRPASHLEVVSVGTVLGGGVLGLVAGGLLVNQMGNEYGEGTFLGSDGRTLTITSLAGAGLSVLYLQSRWDELKGRGVDVGPAVIHGRLGVSTRVRF